MEIERVSIGRASECTLNIPESFVKVSNEHADIHLADGILTFFDHSSNGTVINGQIVHNSSRVIKRGDLILLANSYELKWSEIDRLFPNLHRPTERFDGSQVEINGRKTELIDAANNDRGTERLGGSEVGDNEPYTPEPLGPAPEGDIVRGQLNEYTQAEIEEITEKWNLGAFLSSWVWAMANHIFWPLVIIPISLVPYIGQIASLFLCTYLGLNGNKLAWSKTNNRNFKKYINRQKKWIGFGIFLFVAFALVQALSIYFIL